MSSSSSRALRLLLSLLFPTLALVAPLLVFEGLGDSETAFLVRLSVLVLTSIAAVDAVSARVPTSAPISLAITTTLVVFPPGDLIRGATVSLLLVGGLLWTFHFEESLGETRPERRAWRTTALLIATQFLFRSADLADFSLSLRGIVILLLFPAAAATAALILARQRGNATAHATLLVALAVGRGLTIASTAALVVLALSTLGEEEPDGEMRLIRRAAPFLPLPLLFWRPDLALFLITASACFVHPRLWAGLVLIGGAVLTLGAEVAPWGAVARDSVGMLVLLVPAIGWVGVHATRSGHFRGLMTGVLLLAISLRIESARHDLLPIGAVALLLLILAAIRRSPEIERFVGMQATWLLLLLGVSLLLVSYPSPLAASTPGDWIVDWLPHPAWLLVLAVIGSLAIAAPPLRRLSSGAGVAALLFCLIAGSTAGALTTRRDVLSEWPARQLSSPRELLDLGTATFDTGDQLTIDSALSHAEALPPGTLIGTVELLAEGQADSTPAASWPLRAGIETAEWSTRAEQAAPIAAWIAPAAVRGHRYRARLAVEVPAGQYRVRVRRSPDLPVPTTLTLFRSIVERPAHLP